MGGTMMLKHAILVVARALVILAKMVVVRTLRLPHPLTGHTVRSVSAQILV